MRAAVLQAFGEPLAVREVGDPAPAPGEVLVGVRAAAICQTDLKILAGAIPTVTPPRVLGHEAAGEVVALGPGVTSAREGDRVAVSIDIVCGSCPYCEIGQLGYCARLRRIGFEQDGALATLLAVPARNLLPLADGVSYEAGSTLPDAVGSSYRAVVTQARVRMGEAVAVYGLGGLGLVAVQLAAHAGARVLAIARNPARRELARTLGAEASLDPEDGELPERLRELTKGLGVHAFLDFVGTRDSVQQALLACRKGGRIVVVGYVAPELVASMRQLVYTEVSIVGSRGSSRADLTEAAELVARGSITPVIDRELDLAQVNEGLDALREGSVIGRIVLHP